MLELTPGTILENRYEILRPLGRGGMGTVYLAEDSRLNRPCAVKIALHTDPEAKAQFRREAGFLANLHHNNLPRVIDYFTQGDRYFLVMDYVQGRDFGEIVQQEGPQPEARVLQWLPQILDALEYLHGQKPQPVIHRDIKPANIKLTPEGRVMLVDFGIAKRYDPLLSTVAGARGFSPGFSPPEQYGEGHTDARSDIFSLGATLYYLLTGVAPVDAANRIAGARLTPPRQHNPRISPATERAILRAMEMDRNDRFPSVREFRQALIAERPPTPPVAPTVSVGSPVASRVPIGPVVGLVAALLVVALVAFGVSRLGSAGSRGAAAGSGSTTVAIGPSTTPVALPPSLTPTREPASPTVTRRPTEAPVRPIRATSTLRPTPTWTRRPTPRAPTPTWTRQPTRRVPTPTATPKPSATLISEPRPSATRVIGGIEFVYVPAGEFTMGSTDAEVDAALELCRQFYKNCERERFEDELPQHTVTLDAFWISKTEVTNAQYRRFVDVGGYQQQELWTEAGWTWKEDNDRTAPGFWDNSTWNQSAYPVVGVTWYEAVAYARWLAQQTGLDVRLPSEAEWEKAARGTDGRTWPWGEEPPDGTRLNYCDRNCEFDRKDEAADDGYPYTAPAGSYPAGASPYGALGMAGNVWEWTHSLYKDYPYAPDDGRENLKAAGGRVVRGGSWVNNQNLARCAHRGWDYPDSSDNYFGLRLVSPVVLDSGS